MTRKMFRLMMSDRLAPIDLVEIRLLGVASTGVIRLTNAGQSITWNSNAFKPVQLSRGTLEEVLATEAGTVPSASLQVSNIDLQMAGLLNKAELEQAEVTMYVADRRLLGNPRDALKIYVGELRSPTLNERTFSFDVVNIVGMMEGVEVPRRIYQSKCNYRFGAPWCGVNLSSSPNTIASTTQAGTSEYAIALPGTVASTLGGDANDNWVEGYILFKNGPTALQWREIHYVNTGVTPNLWYVRSPFLDNPGVGADLLVRRGCPRTPTACAARQPDGTSKNFGGFPNVPYQNFAPVRFEEPRPHSV